ncbi:unnamed protein product [Cercospora beticola]|nr:unnamed protein product [Cercospora beticola]
MRMSLADMMRMAKAFKDSEENTPPSAEEETDTIYYLKTSTPHLYDISMSGPYKMLPQLFLQAAHNFGPECRPGIDTLNDFVIDEEHFVPFQHISSPINGNPNLVRRVQLIRRTNAQIAEKLPCPVWNVVYAQPRLEGPQQVSLGIVPMRTLDILDSFESKNEANAAARQKMSELLVKEGQARHRSVEMPMPGGTFGDQVDH